MLLEGLKPQLVPHEVYPAPDNPDSEKVIVDTISGRAMLLTNDESQCFRNFDGSEVRIIASKIWNAGSQPLVTMGKLLRDLNRFGYLAAGALPELESHHARWWHIWSLGHGRRSEASIDPGARKASSVVGRLLSSQVFVLAAVLVFLIALTIWWSAPFDSTALVIGDSPALGILILLLSSCIMAWLGAWLQTRAVTAACGYVCEVAVETGLGIPLPWLDLSSLIAVPKRLRLRTCAAGPLAMLALGALGYLIGYWGGMHYGAMAITDAGLQILYGSWIAVLIFSSPWWGSPFAHMAVVYLRAANPLMLGINGVRAAVFSLFGLKSSGQRHTGFLLIWGAWAIVWPILVVRLLTAVFRKDIPLLIRMLSDEAQTAAWWGLLLLTAMIAIGILGVVLSTAWLLISGFLSVIERRLWPEWQGMLVVAGFVIVLFVLWHFDHPLDDEVAFFASSVTVILGLALTWIALKLTSGDWCGVDALPFVALALVGLAAAIGGFGIGDGLTGWAWLIISVLIIASLALWGATGMVYAGAAILGGLASAHIIGVLILDLSPKSAGTAGTVGFYCQNWLTLPGRGLVEWAYVFSLGVFVVRALVSMRGRDFPAWLWLFIALVLDTDRGILETRNIWPQLSPFVHHAGLAAAIAALVCRRGARAFQLSRAQMERVSDPFSGLNVEINRLTGLSHPCARAGVDFPNIDQALRRCLGKRTWNSVMMRWVPHLKWDEALEYLYLTNDWDKHLDGIKVKTERAAGESLLRIPCLRSVRIDAGQIGKAAHLLAAKPGDVLIRQGATDDALFTIIKGRIAIEIHDTGIGTHTIAQLDAGTYVGEIAFLTGKPRTATVRAVDPLVVAGLRRLDASATCPELDSHMHQMTSGLAWSGKLRKMPIFAEMSESLFLRTVVQGEMHTIEPGQSIALEYERKPAVAAVLNGEIVANGRILAQGALAGVESLWSGENNPIQIKTATDTKSRIVVLPRELVQEAVDEIILDAGMI